MQEEGNVKDEKRPGFKIKKRWFTLCLLIVWVLLFIVALGKGYYLSALLLLPIILNWSLFEIRCRHNVFLENKGAACNNPDLLNIINPGELLSADYTPMLFHRFKTAKGPLLVVENSFALIVEKLLPEDILRAAINQDPTSKTYQYSAFRLTWLYILVSSLLSTYMGSNLQKNLLFIWETSLGWAVFLVLLIMVILILLALSLMDLFTKQFSIIGNNLEIRQFWNMQTIPLENITDLTMTTWSMTVWFMENGKSKQVSLMQLGLTQSLIPLYLFLRFTAPKLTAPIAAPNICDGVHG